VLAAAVLLQQVLQLQCQLLLQLEPRRRSPWHQQALLLLQQLQLQVASQQLQRRHHPAPLLLRHSPVLLQLLLR
jgi:hypothetical protein